MQFPHRRGRADAATAGGPDPRERHQARLPGAADPQDRIRVKSRNFH
jgi:hypothetical protein